MEVWGTLTAKGVPMKFSKSQMLIIQTHKLHKLLLGFIGVAAAAVIGTAGVVAAAPSSSNDPLSTPSVVAFCKAHYKQLGFKNVGQCVSHLNGHGHGYGGSDNDNDHGDNGHHHHNHHHFHNFFGGWWHDVEHRF